MKNINAVPCRATSAQGDTMYRRDLLNAMRKRLKVAMLEQERLAKFTQELTREIYDIRRELGE